MPFDYFILYKPYGYLSQFTQDHPGQKTLKDLVDVPTDCYPVGRLDKDSEGLLLLTNDKRVNKAYLSPGARHHRTYLVQVEGIPTEEAIKKLQEGIAIRVGKRMYRTLPAKVKSLSTEPQLPDREPPVRYRKRIPESWLEICLREGKNRQIRKMCAAAGFPVLRLVRTRKAGLYILGTQPGQYRKLDQKEVTELMKLLGLPLIT